MKRMLITGVTGLLGGNLVEPAAGEYEVFGIAHRSREFPTKCTPNQIDLKDRMETFCCLERIFPNVIVHCAAMTDVDACEANPEAACLLHVDASRLFAEWARENKCTFVYVSTDSVFDGCTGNYGEEDLSAPVNEYARTKLAGEHAVRSANSCALILRTNFYGWSGSKRHGLADWIISKLTAGEQVEAFADVYFNPVYAGVLAKMILRLTELGAVGTFHVAAKDACSKYEFAVRLANVLGLDSNQVVPVLINDFPFRARRPRNTTLATEKASQFLGQEMPTLEEGLGEFRRLLEQLNVAIPKTFSAPESKAIHIT